MISAYHVSNHPGKCILVLVHYLKYFDIYQFYTKRNKNAWLVILHIEQIWLTIQFFHDRVSKLNVFCRLVNNLSKDYNLLLKLVMAYKIWK